MHLMVRLCYVTYNAVLTRSLSNEFHSYSRVNATSYKFKAIRQVARLGFDKLL